MKRGANLLSNTTSADDGLAEKDSNKQKHREKRSRKAEHQLSDPNSEKSTFTHKRKRSPNEWNEKDKEKNKDIQRPKKQKHSDNELNAALGEAAKQQVAAEESEASSAAGAAIEVKSTDGRPTLHVAAGEGNVPAIQALLAAGAVIEGKDSNGRTALHAAAKTGQVPAIQALLAAGAAIEAKTNYGSTALHIAAHAGQAAAIQALSAAGAAMDAKDNGGGTALHGAAYAGQVRAIEALLAGEAAIEVRANDGLTALHVAAQIGQVSAIQALLAAGAAIEAKTKEGLTALHVAAYVGQVPAIQALLAAGAAIEAKTNSGETPLHYAASRGRVPVIKCLLSKNASYSAVFNVQGNTPLHLCAVAGNLDAIQVFSIEAATCKNRFRCNTTPNDQNRIAIQIIQAEHPTLLGWDRRSKSWGGSLVDARQKCIEDNGRYAYYISSYSPNHEFNRVVMLEENANEPSGIDAHTIVLQHKNNDYIVYWCVGSDIIKRNLDEFTVRQINDLLPDVSQESNNMALIEILKYVCILDNLQRQKDSLDKSKPEDSEQIKELDTEIGRGLYYRLPTELKAHIREFIFHSRPLSYTKGEEEKTDRIAQIYSELVEKSNKP